MKEKLTNIIVLFTRYNLFISPSNFFQIIFVSDSKSYSEILNEKLLQRYNNFISLLIYFHWNFPYFI